MDTLWVPIAREVPIRARDDKEEKWLLSGGEAEGAFMRELPPKKWRKNGRQGHEQKLAAVPAARASNTPTNPLSLPQIPRSGRNKLTST